RHATACRSTPGFYATKMPSSRWGVFPHTHTHPLSSPPTVWPGWAPAGSPCSRLFWGRARPVDGPPATVLGRRPPSGEAVVAQRRKPVRGSGAAPPRFSRGRLSQSLLSPSVVARVLNHRPIGVGQTDFGSVDILLLRLPRLKPEGSDRL